LKLKSKEIKLERQRRNRKPPRQKGNQKEKDENDGGEVHSLP